ncbi:unnamed protein product [Arabidopsis halleri]
MERIKVEEQVYSVYEYFRRSTRVFVILLIVVEGHRSCGQHLDYCVGNHQRSYGMGFKEDIIWVVIRDLFVSFSKLGGQSCRRLRPLLRSSKLRKIFRPLLKSELHRGLRVLLRSELWDAQINAKVVRAAEGSQTVVQGYPSCRRRSDCCKGQNCKRRLDHC